MQIRPAQRKPKKSLPSAGPLKRNPRELDKILNQALKDSMSTSDAISTVMPEVRRYPEPS